MGIIGCTGLVWVDCVWLCCWSLGGMGMMGNVLIPVGYYYYAEITEGFRPYSVSEAVQIDLVMCASPNVVEGRLR